MYRSIRLCCRQMCLKEKRKLIQLALIICKNDTEMQAIEL